MNKLKTLNKGLLKTTNAFPKDSWSILDFYYKSNYDDYTTAIKNADGRKITVMGNSIKDISTQLKKLLLISDTIIFNVNNYDDKPSPAFFPFPQGFDSNILQIVTVEDADGSNQIIPNLTQLMQVWSAFNSDKKLSERTTLLGFDFNNPDLSWQRNPFTLTSHIIKDKFGTEYPLILGFCYKYDQSTYDFLFNEGKDLLDDGNIVFAPFIRSPQNNSDIERQLFKAGVIDTSLFIEDNQIKNLNGELHLLSDLNVPYIENVSLKLLSQIIKDEGQSLKEFRKIVNRAIEDIQTLKDREQIVKEIRYLKRNLFEDEFEKVGQLCKKVTKMKSLSAVGAVVTTGVISISSYYGLDIASIILAGGGTATVAANELYRAYEEKNDIRKNPTYFLWKVKNVTEKV